MKRKKAKTKSKPAKSKARAIKQSPKKSAPKKSGKPREPEEKLEKYSDAEPSESEQEVVMGRAADIITPEPDEDNEVETPKSSLEELEEVEPEFEKE